MSEIVDNLLKNESPDITGRLEDMGHFASVLSDIVLALYQAAGRQTHNGTCLGFFLSEFRFVALLTFHAQVTQRQTHYRTFETGL